MNAAARGSRRANLPSLAANDTRHGSYAGYAAGCGGPRCTAAAAEYEAGRLKDQILGLPRRIPITGDRRRLRALEAMGWPLTVLSLRAGFKHKRSLYTILGRRWITRQNHDRIVALYDELAMVPGPSQQTRASAKRRGFASPLAWNDATIDDPASRPVRGYEVPAHVDYDWLVVDKLCGGERVEHTTIPERREVVRRLHALGMNDSRIEARTGISRRTCERVRDELGLATIPGDYGWAGAA